jgi:hypothetical protein
VVRDRIGAQDADLRSLTEAEGRESGPRHPRA